jgi:uncharacterized delta-60 repeat protein
MKKQLLITFTVIIFGITAYAQPGSLDLTFNPIDVGSGNGANNDVLTTSIQSDGKIIIGGNFTSYNGNVINRIARLNTDGTLDTTFNPGTGANNSVYTTSIQSDGKIIIGGDFTTYNGIPILGIARLNTNGTLDTTFNAYFYNDNVNVNSVRTTSIQSDGKIIIGGAFRFQLTISSIKIARLNTNGTLDASFSPGTGANRIVFTTSIQSDGKIIIGGQFTSYNGIAINRIARLNTNGTLDTTFNQGAGVTGGTSSTGVNTISIQSDGKIIIGGEFTTYNGIARDKIARLNTDGTLDTTFNPATGQFSVVNSTSIQSNGKIIIGYTNYNDTTKGIARLNTNGTLDATFTPPQINLVYTTSIQSDGKIIIGCFLSGITRLNTDGTLDTTFDRVLGGSDDTVYTTSIQSDGKIIIGGGFSSYNGIPRNNIVRLNANGTLDTSFISGTGADNAVITTSIQSDGKIIIGGLFTFYNGIARNHIARLNTNGTLDTTFNPGTGATGANINSISSTSIQSDGKIIIGGDFASFNGVARSCIARLNTDGTLDTTFNPGTGFNKRVFTTSIQSDGKIIIGGFFTTYNGISRNRITRLNTNGTLDATFNPGTGTGTNSDLVLTTSIQSDGKIIIGGRFASFNGISRNGIARLNTDGTLDATFDPGTGTGTNALRYPSTTYIQSDGKIIIGGIFTTYNNIVRNNIARLNTNGTLDATFNPGTGANNSVRATSIQSDGKIIISGSFTGYNDKGRNRITRINGNNVLSTNVFNKNTMVIYPNPSNGIYNLQTNEMNAAKSISIYTILGQKIYDAAISSNETTIDISNQPKGVYLYKVLGEEGETKSGKLVIE